VNEPLRVVIAGGGTGGHLYPGIAVAREFLSRDARTRISFAGTAQGIEARVIPREGFPLDLLHSVGVKGKSLVSRLGAAALVPVSVIDALGILASRRPDLVIGVGGYSSWPVLAAAKLRGVPAMLLEQNAVPGLANRLAAPLVKAAAVTFESSSVFFGGKAFVSGNPVRPEFFATAGPSKESAHDDQTSGIRVLVFGGSQGAHAINMAMVEAAPRLADSGLHLTHQTGERDVALVRGGYGNAGLQADVEPYYDDMGQRLGQADLIVSRSGATTLAEIAAAGRAAILIPLPTATDDHQRKNAEAVAAAGAADVLPQSDATGDVLAGRILALARDGERRRGMAAAAKRLAKPDAAKDIVDRALTIAGRHAR
jgi:UDP-N-acetylglucosamine--N-acetylmuramyl-(pentapeptide) pyrophosphoryl-undecaprenol N-acetylglucosamine transferase